MQPDELTRLQVVYDKRQANRAIVLSIVAFALGCAMCWGITTLRPFERQQYGNVIATGDARTEDDAVPPAALTQPGDWAQWGGSPIRNNVPEGLDIPVEWEVGTFDRRTGEWDSSSAENVLWVARVGSQTYGNPVVANGKIYVGTNNGGGYLARYPASIDLGCLLAFDVKDGKFLWQDSSEKLPTGRVHDWPLQGICCAPLVEGDRLWFVTSRGEVKCLDTQGYHDGEDDGPQKAGWGSLFREPPDMATVLNDKELPLAIEALLKQANILVSGHVRVDPDASGQQWKVTVREGTQSPPQILNVSATDRNFQLARVDGEGVATEQLAAGSLDLTDGLDNGKINPMLRAMLQDRWLPIQEVKEVRVVEAGRKWAARIVVDEVERDLEIRREGPQLAAYKQITPEDTTEADVIWTLDMMDQLKISQHNMCSCSVTALGDILFVNTSNGVDESHIVIPNIEAPSFIALDKNTGEVLWTDDSPGANIIHGQWSSPTVAEIAGVPQVIFSGGDGWVYGFRADRGTDGSPEMLWRFDANPKTAKWVLGGRGTRNEVIGTPVVYKDRVYFTVGQDPEHGEGDGRLWCIDPTKRGDISAELAVRVDDRSTIIPHRRLQAVDEEEGEIAIDNPNSGVIWQYSQYDQDGDGEFAFEECIHRSVGTVAIKDDLLFVADLSGVFHCVDAMTGKVHWTHDMMAQSWGSPLIVDGKVYIGDEDGEVAVFELKAEPHEPIAINDMRNSVYSTPIIANNILYISNKTHLFAIEATP